ncbi:tagatose 1,6-diphosphate aldolase [Calycina marina]|uniref:Fructose-bisphosphate aldolase n=1 Tax=Calycina marina TaxID=1763456 RepID=A0A9P7Z121_9HELO|nr:tagatose 1,6-diphosphate aldolase [Calycina marina]
MAPPANWKESNKMLQILQEAEKGGYGVVAIIAYNFEPINGFVRAAEKAKSPFITLYKSSHGPLLEWTSHPYRCRCYQQDERPTMLAVEIKLFHSIMVDMSPYEKEENLAKPAALVKYCQEKGIATEAEPGRVEARLEQTRKSVNSRARIVLHGTNGFEPELMEECIATSCSKLIVNRAVLGDYYEHFRKHAPTISQEVDGETTEKVISGNLPLLTLLCQAYFVMRLDLVTCP